MMKPLTGSKIAVLVANGFDEKSFIATQKMMMEMGASLKIISTNQGLVNGWDGQGWGHNYAVDAPLNTALGVDYDAVIIPGGERSIDKLKLTAHTRRFIGSFMAANKPVVVMDDSIMLMAMCEQVMDKKVTGPESTKEMVESAGGHWMNDMMVAMDGSMMSGMTEGESQEEYFSTMRELMMQNAPMDKAA